MSLLIHSLWVPTWPQPRWRRTRHATIFFTDRTWARVAINTKPWSRFARATRSSESTCSRPCEIPPVLVRKQQRWWRVFRRCSTAIDCRESQIKSSALFSFRSSFRLPFNLERWKLWTLNSVVEEGLVYFCFLSSTTSNADYSLVSVSFAFCFSWTQDVSQILISQRSCCRILSISEYGR